MNAAAALSIRSARLARLTSAAIIARSTAAVDQRSSQSSTGSARGARLRAKARTDWVRGLSLPSMLSGSPTTNPTTDCAATSAFSASRSAANFLRMIVLSGVAKLHPASQSAVPIVLVPTSSPARRPPPGSARAKSEGAVVIIPALLSLGCRAKSRRARMLKALVCRHLPGPGPTRARPALRSAFCPWRGNRHGIFSCGLRERRRGWRDGRGLGLEAREPAQHVGADVRPEEGDVEDVIIVAGKHIAWRIVLRDFGVANHQEAARVIAAGANDAGDELALLEPILGFQRADIRRRGCFGIGNASDRVRTQHPRVASRAAVIADCAVI